MLDFIDDYKKKLDERDGQSLIEVLIATVVGVIMIMAAVSIIVPAMKGGTDGTKKQVSIALGKEMMDNVRVWAESDWHNISTLATSSANKYILRLNPSPFAVASGTESVVIDSLSGLVGYWRMDEAGSSVIDSSFTVQDGTMYYNAVETDVHATSGCKFGDGCGSFDGTNKYARIPDSAAYDIGSEGFTYTAWINPSSFPNSYNMFMGHYLPYFNVQPGRNLHMSMYAAGAQRSVYGSTLLNAGEWYFVSATYDSSGYLRVFVNGQQDGIAGPYATPGNYNSDMFIGSWYSGLSYKFAGLVDEARVYNRALSASEISQLYRALVYNRYFYLDDVNRDGSGNITAGAGSWDPSTKKLTVVYGWPGSTTSSVVSYLTRSGSQIFLQSDWSGGGGYVDPTDTVSNRFSSSTNINFTTSTGSIMINL